MRLRPREVKVWVMRPVTVEGYRGGMFQLITPSDSKRAVIGKVHALTHCHLFIIDNIVIM